jgi:site-specific DNA recombinase
MTAAIYARKSTDQSSVADDQKSVTRQIEHARQYAGTKGWTVPDHLVFVDDGISGAEFEERRPGFGRLMNALKPRPPFQILIMAEESRLGREMFAVGYALKQIVQAGVRVFYYLEGRERTLDSPTDKIMASLTQFADELERERARQRTYDALQRKAKAGHVTGGRVFGYDNVRTANGHVERAINEAEATVVRRIFALCADGVGKSRIAKTLNAEHAPSPRAQQGRPKAWAPSSVHELLYRPLYRGELVWNQTAKRNKWGQVAQSAKPESEWMRVSVPHLRIVPEELWRATHARLGEARTRYLRATDGRLYGRPRDLDSKYLLAGLARCSCCKGAVIVKSGSHGRGRAYFYACGSYHQRGNSVCRVGRKVRMADLDALVLARIRGVFSADVIDAAVERAFTILQSGEVDAALTHAQTELPAVEAEIERLTAAIIHGGSLPPLVEALKARQARAEALRATIASATASSPAPLDWTAVRGSLHARAREWRALMTGHVAHARQILRKVLVGPVLCQLEDDRVDGAVNLQPLISGAKGLPRFLASPPGFEPGFQP